MITRWQGAEPGNRTSDLAELSAAMRRCSSLLTSLDTEHRGMHHSGKVEPPRIDRNPERGQSNPRALNRTDEVRPRRNDLQTKLEDLSREFVANVLETASRAVATASGRKEQPPDATRIAYRVRRLRALQRAVEWQLQLENGEVLGELPFGARVRKMHLGHEEATACGPAPIAGANRRLARVVGASGCR
jgi:hypothetical protein